MAESKNRSWTLGIPLFFLVACAAEAPQQPDLVSAHYQPPTGTPLAINSMTPVQKLHVIDFYDLTAPAWPNGAILPEVPSDLVPVEGSLVPAAIYLGFSQLLQGSLIETVTKNNNGQVTQLTPISNAGIVEVWSCPITSDCQQPKSYTQIASTAYEISYRPDGGYTPKADTSIDNFPHPALRFKLIQSLPASSIVVIYLIAGKLANPDGTKMAQIVTPNNVSVVTPANSAVAGAVWFQTK